MRRACPLLAAGALMAAGPATAQSRDMQTVWTVEAAAAPTGERALAAGEFVLKQRLLPSGLAELAAPVTLGSQTLPAGTQLIEVQTADAKVFCTPAVARQKLLGASFQPCLVDGDRDGDFDGWFNTVSQTRGLLTVGGVRPKKPKGVPETRYAVVAPATMRDTYFVAIERRNWFNLYSLESFSIAFGRDGDLDRLTTPVSFKTAEMPRPVEVMGARFTALSETAGRMRVRVDAAMPTQPFGVVRTTTYSFY